MVDVALCQDSESVGSVAAEPFTPMQYADEPMLFSASYEYARAMAGPLTHAALDAIPFERESPDPEYPHLNIDSRVHMLMPGMWPLVDEYPAIPGWHCDFTPRSPVNGQPIPYKASKARLHTAVFLSDVPEVSRTEFLENGFLHVSYDKQRVWGSIDEEMERGMVTGYTPVEGNVIAFSGQTLHRATPAKARGWRFFLRVSWKQERPTNQIRRQTQTYIQPNTGW